MPTPMGSARGAALTPIDPAAGFRLRPAPAPAPRPAASLISDEAVGALSAVARAPPQPLRSSAIPAPLHRSAEPMARTQPLPSASVSSASASASASPRRSSGATVILSVESEGAGSSLAAAAPARSKRSSVTFGTDAPPPSPPPPVLAGSAKRRKLWREPSEIAAAAPPAAPGQCEAISSRQWFANCSRKKRECAVCRYEGRRPTAVTDFCRAHGLCLCSRVHPSAAAAPGMCPETGWTCWMKFHRFYLPARVFSAKGNMRRSAPLYKLRHAFIQSGGDGDSGDGGGAAPAADEPR